jgi:MoxR-like ATPase
MKLIGNSMIHLAIEVELALRRGTSILLTGETGTGKSLLARHVGEKFGPYEEMSCVDPGDHLFRSSLFGYVKGAYSGSDPKGSPGILGKVTNGTLFLDEIGDLNEEAQAPLLRLLDQRKYRKLGDNRDITVNTHFLAATNKPKLRADLKARFKEIEIPPLRERREEIPEIIQHILDKINVRFITGEALVCLIDKQWKQNYRQIQTRLDDAVCNTILNSPEYLTYGSLIEKGDHLAIVVDKISISTLPSKTTSWFRRWKNKAGVNLRDPLATDLLKEFDVRNRSFCEAAKKLYISFAKSLGVVEEWHEDPFRLLNRQGVLSRWIEREEEESEEEELAPDTKGTEGLTDNDKKLLLLLKVMPNYEIRQIELLYWLSLYRATGKLSLSAFARKANVSDKKAKKAFADAKIDPTKNNSEDVILQKARSIHQNASLSANSTSMKTGRNA